MDSAGAGDSGGAIGAAFLGQFKSGRTRTLSREGSSKTDQMSGSLLGPEFSSNEIETVLQRLGAKFKRHSQIELIAECVKGLEWRKALAWFQGRMEFGPRALGARSILADPRRTDAQSTLNLRIKFKGIVLPIRAKCPGRRGI